MIPDNKCKESMPPISVVPKGCQIATFAGFSLAIIAALWIYWLMPFVATHLTGPPNRLRVVLVDESGAPMTNGSINFSLSRMVPVIPVPYGGERWVGETRTAISDAKGVAEVVWPNMDLAVRTVSVAGVSFPIEPIYTLSGSVVARTPDGKSSLDIGTNYTARIVINRAKHSAKVE